MRHIGMTVPRCSPGAGDWRAERAPWPGRPEERMRTLRALPSVLAVALVATAASGCSNRAAPAPGGAAVVTVAPGVSVQAPASVRITSSPEPAAARSLQRSVRIGARQLPGALAVLATPRRLITPSALPAGGVVLSFQVSPQRVAAGTQPFLASLDPATGTWVPVASSYDAATGVVSARIMHFSVWAPFDWVRARIAALFKGALMSLFGLAGFGTAPACAGQAVAVTDSKPAGGVAACAAVATGDDVAARIVDQRPYAIDVLYPPGARVSVPTADPFAQLGADLTNVVSSWHDRALLTGGGQADATVSLPPGDRAEFATEYDGEALLFGVLGTAIRMLVQLTAGVAADTARELIAELDGLSCLTATADTSDRTSLSVSAAEQIGSAAFSCLALAAKGVGAVVFTVASIAASLAVELVSDVWSAIDTVIGDANHLLVLTRAAIIVRIAEDQFPYNSAGAYRPAAVGLAGDGTFFLSAMMWSAWTSAEAVGTGTALIDDCDPSCAAGHVYHVPVTATFTRPVKYCRATYNGPQTVPHYFWSRVSFIFPAGLPAPVEGVANPWVFAGLTQGAQQSCQ
jgi:hypothetical protein